MFTEGRKDGITESRIYGITEGQAESSIAPLFQSGAINTNGVYELSCHTSYINIPDMNIYPHY